MAAQLWGYKDAEEMPPELVDDSFDPGDNEIAFNYVSFEDTGYPFHAICARIITHYVKQAGLELSDLFDSLTDRCKLSIPPLPHKIDGIKILAPPAPWSNLKMIRFMAPDPADMESAQQQDFNPRIPQLFAIAPPIPWFLFNTVKDDQFETTGRATRVPNYPKIEEFVSKYLHARGTWAAMFQHSKAAYQTIKAKGHSNPEKFVDNISQSTSETTRPCFGYGLPMELALRLLTLYFGDESTIRRVLQTNKAWRSLGPSVWKTLMTRVMDAADSFLPEMCKKMVSGIPEGSTLWCGIYYSAESRSLRRILKLANWLVQEVASNCGKAKPPLPVIQVRLNDAARMAVGMATNDKSISVESLMRECCAMADEDEFTEAQLADIKEWAEQAKLIRERMDLESEQEFDAWSKERENPIVYEWEDA